VSTGLYKATPERLLDKAGLSGESVSSATTEGGKNRSVQGNPGRAPRSKTKLQVERKQQVLTYFRWWVESKKPPGKAEVEVYMKKYGIPILNSEHYKVYKNCVYSQYRKKLSLFVALHNGTCEQ